MPIALRMPKWGMIMEEGSLQAWLVNEGDPIQQGQGIAEIESDKTVQALESPASGVLAKKLAEAGSTVAVGKIIGIIAIEGDTDESIQKFMDNENKEKLKAEEKTNEATENQSEPSLDGQLSSVNNLRQRNQITPAALRLAKENDVDWTHIEGTGPDGRIQISDIEKTIKKAGNPIALSKLRQAIAKRTTLSIQAPQAALCRHIDLTEFLKYRELINKAVERTGQKISLTACIIPFITKILSEIPELNCRLTAEGLFMNNAIHLGIVAQGNGGIFVPVIRDAHIKKLSFIESELKTLLQKASRNELSEEDMRYSTFTFSNAGPFGIDIFQPLLNPPETAILGMGCIRKRPWVIGNSILPRETAWFCITTDHRVIDGGPAGKFLTRIDELLQKPSSVLDGLIR